MKVERLYASDVETVLNQELTLGHHVDAKWKINNKITYHVKTGIYTVYSKEGVESVSGSRKLALKSYNDLNNC